MESSIQKWFGDHLQQGRFLNQYRYYAGILGRLHPIEDPAVPVMGVSAYNGQFYLHINPTYFRVPAENMKYLDGVLLHEVHHLILGHVGNPRYANPRFPQLMTLAMEISANENIVEPLPGNPPRWEMFKQYGIRPNQSTWERYEIFAEYVEAGCKGGTYPTGTPIDTHLPNGVGGFENAEVISVEWNLRMKGILEQVVDEVQAEMRNDPSKKVGMMAGKSPSYFIENLLELKGPAIVDWRKKLRMFIGYQRIAKHTYTRPNRRFQSMVGVIPGRSHQPDRMQPKKMIVAIDTSGSMTSEELAIIARELRALSDLVKFIVVECDATIQRVYPFQKKLPDVKGRGGTDLRPVFEPEFLKPLRADGVIYFTDGMGPYPAIEPDIKTLWVLSGGYTFKCPWGEKVPLRAVTQME